MHSVEHLQASVVNIGEIHRTIRQSRAVTHVGAEGRMRSNIPMNRSMFS